MVGSLQNKGKSWLGWIGRFELDLSVRKTNSTTTHIRTIQMTRPRIGAVSYLNTKPLVYGLESLADECSVIFDLPSRLADRLADGELDAALIPSIEAALNPEYTIVSDACIGCRGPVWSVKLLSRVDPEAIQSVSLDEGSRTSAALTRILLAEKFSVRPEFHPLSIHDDWKSVDTDAVLVIGDRAMNMAKGPFSYSWDLGEVWNQWTGMPFVFAMWTAANERHLDHLSWLLTRSRNSGVSNLSAIADHHAKPYNLSSEQAQKYLSEHLHFYLGTEEKSALKHYYQLAAKHQLLENEIELNFHDCQTPQ